jgi:hypothetical protein
MKDIYRSGLARKRELKILSFMYIEKLKFEPGNFLNNDKLKQTEQIKYQATSYKKSEKHLFKKNNCYLPHPNLFHNGSL